MQTFLPYPDFASSARVLDWRRLGKQRVEAMQILRTNLGLSDAWANHPATLMWRGYEQALASYGLAICEEWRARGYHDTAWNFFAEFLAECPEWTAEMDPPWLGEARLHASHRAALLAKDAEWYGQWGWSEAPEINYWWPTKGPV